MMDIHFNMPLEFCDISAKAIPIFSSAALTCTHALVFMTNFITAFTCRQSKIPMTKQIIQSSVEKRKWQLIVYLLLNENCRFKGANMLKIMLQ